MPRRKPYTKVEKRNQLRARHVEGMGDVPLKAFQCLNSECVNFILIRADKVVDGFSIICGSCGFIFEDGGASKFYDYDLQEIDPSTKEIARVLESGALEIEHREYVENALDYKYCIICNAAKPFQAFDRHASRKTGHQGECRQCKTIYNSIKNQTRLSDQHREAAQKRRLYVELAQGDGKIDTKVIFDRFENKCFKCGKTLTDDDGDPAQGAFQLDHTLPASYFWPLTTENGTSLCSEHNQEKSGKWPSEYYVDSELKRLQALTGLDYSLLAGRPCINPDAIEYLKDPENVNHLVTKYGAYMNEIIKLRNKFLAEADFDFFNVEGSKVSDRWIREANDIYEGKN